MEPSKVLVPVSGVKADDEAVRLACRLARKRKGKVYIIYVIQVKRALPLDAEVEPEVEKEERVLDHAERIAVEEDYEVETEDLHAREVGPAIVAEAVERGVDLILVGRSYEKRFGEFSMGSVIPYLLKNAPCPVLVYQEPTP